MAFLQLPHHRRARGRRRQPDPPLTLHMPQLLEALREALILEANFDVSSAGISLQAMDSSNSSLVSLCLPSRGFEHYRCDRSFSMGAWSDVVLLAQ